MPDYQYKGAYPMVYPAEIGNGFEVHPAEGNPSTTGVGTTVVLHPLDVLHTTDPIPFHAWLEPEDGSAFADAVEPETAAEVVPEDDAPPATPTKTPPSGPVPPVETTTSPAVPTDPPVVPAPAGEPKEETK